MSQKQMNKIDAAVSPVVGVMLMIVVTIIIAALVSGMAGGLITGVQKTPSIVVDVGLDQYTQYQSTYTTLTLDVLSVSEPIKSSDVEISLTVMNKTGYHAAGVAKKSPFTGSGTGISNITDGSNIFGNFTIFAGTSISGDIYIQNQTVHNFTTIYNTRHDEAIADEVAVDDINANPMTWGGKL
ncbi:MAG: type IV pilin N-terminal domain-containing protein, partial [Methanocorpusculum sp.]|nr:type IV pilin N-terminal domain-containing protein [Methanocorpusculum sp.]